ncbi:hypothetical protein N7517_009374 [Penicillium concentricum]|uniref:Amidohydrolase-related domain-containing protein n=1 Tax=Penicillium concentricum TaxID=293559 RepID=A0A9W9RH45_9EURO|nr:uncharacterized protein N7517_009374 [Penicillium concentricum]KAJ5360183.1 hypothetical protein N7517_009374 [Penicillium concentricum]
MCISVAIGPNLDVPSGGDLTVIDADNDIVVPGFVNGHHHLWQQLIRGVATDWSLFDYLVKIRSLYVSVYTAEDVELAYYTGAMDLLSNGVTCMLEHSHTINSAEHADAAIRGLKRAGIWGCFCYGFYENPPIDGCHVPGVDLEKFDHTQRVCDARRVRTTMIPLKISPLSGSHRRSPRGGTASREQRHPGSISVFSHGASLTDSELNSIRSASAGLVGTPNTELQMGMGFPAVFGAADKGCKACLGLDITLNQGSNFMAQMRLALQAQRAVDNQAAFPLAIKRKTTEVLRMGTLGGAEVMGLEHLVGSVVVGKRADLVVFRYDDISTVPVYDPTAKVVFHASSSNIDTVIVNGRTVKKDGCLVGVDWPSYERGNNSARSGPADQARAFSLTYLYHLCAVYLHSCMMPVLFCSRQIPFISQAMIRLAAEQA